MMLNDLWAYWALAYASFWVGIGARRLLDSRLLRERKPWDWTEDMDGLLASPEEIEAARRLDL